MENKTFTQEQLDEAIQNAKTEWKEKELNPIVSERDELIKYKPVEKSEEEKALETKHQELIQKEIELELKSVGLDKFADFFNVQKVEDLKPQVEKFQSILNEMKINSAYQPTDHKNTDEYSTAKGKGDTLGMIKALFSSQK
ncbi:MULTISPECIES: hypothetical protein [Bacillaceae]|uniref:DUF4355 domain-containing protein n=1 Tax=Evansella alkalicola TaxID=745819 RepID=A0ABS6JTH9_9BACI|nr:MULTISPECIES: hypothetical protein [Bacillaceae]MBU9720552.1 hypothetical protein [Bacillus alkalicola]